MAFMCVSCLYRVNTNFKNSFSLADLQVVVVAVGVHLVPGVDIEHRVQALGGAGVLFELLHLGETFTETDGQG